MFNHPDWLDVGKTVYVGYIHWNLMVTRYVVVKQTPTQVHVALNIDGTGLRKFRRESGGIRYVEVGSGLRTNWLVALDDPRVLSQERQNEIRLRVSAIRKSVKDMSTDYPPLVMDVEALLTEVMDLHSAVVEHYRLEEVQ